MTWKGSTKLLINFRTERTKSNIVHPQKSDEEAKLTRRVFMQFAASATATTSAVYAMTLKTDAMAQERKTKGFREVGGGPYPYL